MLKAVVFDIDGTLLDTSEYILQAFEHALAHYHLPAVSRKRLRETNGPAIEEVYGSLAPVKYTDELISAHQQFQSQNLHLVKPFSGSAQVLKSLRELGLKLAAVTNRTHKGAETMQQAGLYELIDTMMSGSEVSNMKPHPEGILTVLSRINVGPSDALMVGDAIDDIQAGKNAGTTTAAVTYGIGLRELLVSEQPDYIFDSLNDVVAVATSAVSQQ
jgi:pyrophosphatase PpaX